ncbi:MAG TPA: hypothetical protein VMB26_06835 [Candidatus Binataceae bacterium]|nr:hypothetical protein [Candidatus Binataceae bacterium]
MAEKAQNARDLLTLYKTLLIELPVAGAKSTLGVAKDNELEQSAWKAYDAWIRILSQSASSLYQNPFFGDAFGRSLPGLLRTQQFSNAVSGALFAALRTMAGLPGMSELQAVRSELRDLRLQMRNLIAVLTEVGAVSEQAGARREEAEEELIRALDGRLQLTRREKAKAA